MIDARSDFANGTVHCSRVGTIVQFVDGVAIGPDYPKQRTTPVLGMSVMKGFEIGLGFGRHAADCDLEELFKFEQYNLLDLLGSIVWWNDAC